MNSEWLHQLEKIVQTDLPGEKAHKDMIPYRSLTSQMLIETSDFRESSVAILIYFENHTLKSVLIERPPYDGVHSGQMAFPGGKKDFSDVNLIQTALREMQEEIGFYDPNIQLIGELTKVYIPVSKFLVYPHLFFTKQTPQFTADPYEVKAIIPFNLLEIIENDKLVQTTVETGDGMRIKNVPAFQIENKIVWGATCLMMNELKMCLQKMEY